MGVSRGEHEVPFNPAGKGSGAGRQEEAEERQEGVRSAAINFLSESPSEAALAMFGCTLL